MTSAKFFARCENEKCRKFKIVLFLRGVYIPQLKLTALPRKFLCNDCLKKVEDKLGGKINA